MPARMPGTPFDLGVWIGLPREFEGIITEDGKPDGTPVNLTGAAGTALLKSDRLDTDANAVCEFDVVDFTTAPLTGLVELTMADTESLKLAPGRYHFSLTVKLADAFEFVAAHGMVEAKWPPTRSAD